MEREREVKIWRRAKDLVRDGSPDASALYVAAGEEIDRMESDLARLRRVVEAAREMFHAAHRFDCPNCGRSIVSECGCSFGVLVARVETALALLEGKEPDRGA